MDQLQFDVLANGRRKRRRAGLAILMSTALATFGAGAVSLAVFSDTDTQDADWTTGTVVLDVSTATAFTASDIMPGDQGTRTVTVANSGTGDLRYAMTSSATNDDGKGLAGQLDLTIRAGSCAAPGATLYDATLAGAAFGDPAQGDDAGDRDVAAGASEDLCFSWSFPLSSGNGYQSASTTATFTFDADQTDQNP